MEFLKYLRNTCKVITAIFILVHACCSYAIDRYMTMQPGAVETIKIGSIKRVAVGSDSVAAANVLDTGDLLLIARTPGTTDIMVWTEGDRQFSIKLTVKMFNNKSTVDALRASLKNLDGVNIRDEGGVFIIEGDVPAATKERVNSVVDALGQSGLIGPNIVNLLYTKNNSADPMIRMDVRFVEVNKGAMQKLGIRWQTAMPGPAMGAHVVGTYNSAFGVTSSPEATEMVKNISVNDTSFYGYFGISTLATSIIDMLAEDNQAKTLAAPVLITQSGTEANFLSGGEIPMAVMNALGATTVEFKQYGIQLEMKPRIDDNDLITSSIKTEVSTIDKSVTVQGIPGLLTRRTSSVVAVRDGETIVISGIVKAEDSKSVSKIPLIGDMPVLGELFKSKEFNAGQSELVVFVTPRRTSSGANINTHVVDSAQKQIDDLKSTLKIDSALLE